MIENMVESNQSFPELPSIQDLSPMIRTVIIGSHMEAREMGSDDTQMFDKMSIRTETEVNLQSDPTLLLHSSQILAKMDIPETLMVLTVKSNVADSTKPQEKNIQHDCLMSIGNPFNEYSYQTSDGKTVCGRTRRKSVDCKKHVLWANHKRTLSFSIADNVLPRIEAHKYIISKIDANSYLYGHIWLTTTLLFMLPSFGNSVTYLMQKHTNITTSWSFDLGYLSVAVSGIHGYVIVMSLAFYFLLQYQDSNSGGIVMTLIEERKGNQVIDVTVSALTEKKENDVVVECKEERPE
ncbi:hypothetical protein V6N12_031677 [Hibiscus sabdariffa]|uniref:Uncharacterized protein n=1 Tax=Hibiscus sabdariffa TaxID=183260 RepID=A0ABR2DVC4_9ROSI